MLRTVETENDAIEIAQRLNRSNARFEPVVIVEGTEDSCWSVMDLASAIEGGFFYQIWY